ncbi:hypothetical protein [Pleionea sediminis]|uniref:hypothetical protein n=1 Tax=Pleionea sediminis TaxID=2569479 RepID=UPI001186D8B2|nr:hypothetical protein [Pleionea sediminis]
MRIPFLLLALSLMTSLSAEVYYKSNYYIQCNSCSTIAEYEVAARNHFTRSNHQFDKSGQVDYVFLTSPNFHDVNEDNITIQNLDRYLTIVRISSRARKFSFFPSISASAIPAFRLSTSMKQTLVTKLVEYNDLLKSSASYLSGHRKEPFKATTNWNTIVLEKSFMRYAGNTHLIEQFTKAIPKLMVNTDFNPFLFQNRPISVELESADGYLFTFVKDSTGLFSPWALFSIESSSNQYAQVTDQSGNVSLQSEIPESALCVFNGKREICRSYNDAGRFVYGNRTTIHYSQCPTEACPDPDAPTSCPNGSSQYCKGRETPPGPIFF